MQEFMLEMFSYFFPQHISVSASIEIHIVNLTKQVKL